jgi:hypothetical protein
MKWFDRKVKALKGLKSRLNVKKEKIKYLKHSDENDMI